MEQFSSYPSTQNTAVNLLAISMMRELLIRNIIKKWKHEICSSSQGIH